MANSKPLFLTIYGTVLIGILVSSFYVFSAIYNSAASSSSVWLAPGIVVISCTSNKLTYILFYSWNCSLFIYVMLWILWLLFFVFSFSVCWSSICINGEIWEKQGDMLVGKSKNVPFFFGNLSLAIDEEGCFIVHLSYKFLTGEGWLIDDYLFWHNFHDEILFSVIVFVILAKWLQEFMGKLFGLQSDMILVTLCVW